MALPRLKQWVLLSRPMFHTVGVLPFLLGTVLAWADTGQFRLVVFLLGVTGSVMIMLAAYLAGEYWDIEEDRISSSLPRSRFSGGSGVVVAGAVPRRSVLAGAYAALFVAGIVGILLAVVWQTGPFTIPLGVIGMIGGFCYSSRPVRWVSSGLGEAWIAFCFGWLPVNASYYLQAGRFSSLASWISLPIALSIFLVILVNEFPDHTADRAAGKRNLAVRLGLPGAARLYGGIVLLTWTTLLFSFIEGAPFPALAIQIPVLLVATVTAVFMAKGKWKDPPRLEMLCAATLLVNLGISGGYLAGLLLAGGG